MQEEQNINKNVNGQENNEIINYNQYYSRPPLARGQKIAVAVLAFFSFFIIVAWMVQFKQSISNPLVDQTNTVDTTSVATDLSTVDVSKDSDGDGLVDFDEINTYKTSPYLEDSDSDGFNDGKEVTSNMDPNCPTGVDCSGLVDSSSPETVTDNNVQRTVNSEPITTQAISKQTSLGVSTTTSGDTDELQKVMTGQVDAQTLRKTLLNAGMDKATLDKISDEDLMTSYQETLRK